MDLSSKSVLLVEDNKATQRLCGVYLKKMGIEKFDLAENGRQAVESAKSKLYDIIIMDIRLPDIDGVEATGQIRNLENGGHPKIIAYTAYDNTFEIGKSFDGKILKPANILNFNQVIYDVLTEKDIKINNS